MPTAGRLPARDLLTRLVRVDVPSGGNAQPETVVSQLRKYRSLGHCAAHACLTAVEYPAGHQCVRAKQRLFGHWA